MRHLIYLSLLLLPLETFAEESCLEKLSLNHKCRAEASLYVDQDYAQEICKEVQPGFEECANVTKTDIHGAPVMSDADLIMCVQAQAGFKDCYPLASLALDKRHSRDLCTGAGKGFKSCADKAMAGSGVSILGESGIKSCLGI